MINKHAKSASFSLDSSVLQQVQEYNYLGQVFSADSNHEKEIRSRIGIGWGALGRHSQIMKSKLPLSLKRIVYHQCVLPLETWHPTKQLESKLRSAQQAMERIMIRVTLRDRKQASFVREQTRVEDIVQIKKEMNSWDTKILLMGCECGTRAVERLAIYMACT